MCHGLSCFTLRQNQAAMTGTNIPLGSKEDKTAVGSRTDALAADLVMAAWFRRRRTELKAQIANLQSVQPSAETRLTELTAALVGQMSDSVAHLNLLVDQAELFVQELTRDAPSA